MAKRERRGVGDDLALHDERRAVGQLDRADALPLHRDGAVFRELLRLPRRVDHDADAGDLRELPGGVLDGRVGALEHRQQRLGGELLVGDDEVGERS